MVYPFQTHLINYFVFIDCENVSAKEAFDFLKTHSFFDLQTQIVCLIGADKSQNNWYNDFKDCIANISANITPIRLSKAGKKQDQLLDKILLAYVGFAIGQNQSAEIRILAKDKGYEDVVEHFKSACVNITHENIISQKQNAKSEDQKENPPTKNVANAPKQTVAKKKATKTEKKASKRKKHFDLESAKEKIMEISKTKRPKKIEKLKSWTASNFNSSDLDSDTNELLDSLKSDGKIEVDGEKITWKK